MKVFYGSYTQESRDNTIFAEKFLYYPEDFQIDILEICDDVDFLREMFEVAVRKNQYKLARIIFDMVDNSKLNIGVINQKSASCMDPEFLDFCMKNNSYTFKDSDFSDILYHRKLELLEVALRNGIDLNAFSSTHLALVNCDSISFVQILKLCDKHQKPIDLKKRFAFNDKFHRSLHASWSFFSKLVKYSTSEFDDLMNIIYPETTIANFAVEHNQKQLIDGLREYGIGINELKKSYLTPENRDLLKKLL